MPFKFHELWWALELENGLTKKQRYCVIPLNRYSGRHWFILSWKEWRMSKRRNPSSQFAPFRIHYNSCILKGYCKNSRWIPVFHNVSGLQETLSGFIAREERPVWELPEIVESSLGLREADPEHSLLNINSGTRFETQYDGTGHHLCYPFT